MPNRQHPVVSRDGIMPAMITTMDSAGRLVIEGRVEIEPWPARPVRKRRLLATVPDTPALPLTSIVEKTRRAIRRVRGIRD